RRMDVDDFYSLLLTYRCNGYKMAYMGMYSSIAYQPHQMCRFAVFPGILQAFKQGGIHCKSSVFYRYVYSLEFLVHNTSCTEIEVAYLTVSHLPFGQANRPSKCNKRTMRILLIKGIYKRDISILNGILFLILSEAPTIHYDQNYFFRCHFSKLIISFNI